jgi:TolB-like protein/class 3 adenylate cyclase/Flp pilus assembly protein TadD
MAEKRAQRRLAAILAADVVGYSRLMEQDEAGTFTALKARRQNVLVPLVAQHNGRVVKVMGDGVLVEFVSAVEAVQCAVELQKGFAEANRNQAQTSHILLRIGINLGDVIVEGSDLYGDGVNVAARLEGLAEPGGIFVSGSVYEQVKRKLSSSFDELGPQVVKNIDEPLQVYRVRPQSPSIGETAEVERSALPLPTKPSIAVLPFTNMSTDPEHEPFADGLTEDLITDLSRCSGLFVIARNSTFAYKGKSVDIRRIARELGVRYVLEGSARRAAGRVRINVQLIDAIGGGHMWAERFDRNLEDIFAVQDEVTAKIVEALVGHLTAPVSRKRPRSMEAYDLCVRARMLNEESLQSTQEARLLLKQAIALDPGYAEAHQLLAMNYWAGWSHFGEPIEPNRRKAVTTAEKAVMLDPNDAGSHWTLGHLLAHERQWEESDRAFAAAFELDPNCADAWADLSDLSVLSGRPKEGIDLIRKALRLNPHPEVWYYLVLGQAQYAARQYVAAIETLREGETYRTHSRRFLAASLAQLGRLDEAHRETEMFLISNPHFTISHWVESMPFRDDAARDHFVDGFRKAGLPE